MFRSLQRQQPLRGPSTRVARAPKGGRPPSGDSLLVGFYVNWTDNSFASLRAHAEQLDWIVAEWAFLDRQADTLRVHVDPKVQQWVQNLPTGRQPKVLMMVSNIDSGRQFAGQHAARMLADASAPPADGATDRPDRSKATTSPG